MRFPVLMYWFRCTKNADFTKEEEYEIDSSIMKFMITSKVTINFQDILYASLNKHVFNYMVKLSHH